MPSRATAERFAAEEFDRDQFNRLPILFLNEQMIDLGQQSSLQTLGLTLSGTLHRQTTNRSQVLSGTVPRILTGVSCFGRKSRQSDEDFSLQPIFRGADALLPKLTAAEPFTAWQNTDSLNGAAQRQRNHRVAGFVVGSRFVVRFGHRFAV